jgi:PAS domain S-box-containing protein
MDSDYKPIHILLVEDDETDRMAVQRLLARERLPYQLTMAGTVLEALHSLRQKRPDLILIDYQLPDGSGLEVQQAAGDIPCIFIAGAADQKTAVEAMKAGAYDFMVKDLGRDYLQLLPTVIQASLERRRAQGQLRLQQHIINSLGEMVLLINEAGEIIFANRAVEEELGYKQEEVLGEGWWKLLFTDEEHQRTMKAWAAARVRGEEPPRSYDLELKCRDGRKLWTGWTESQGPNRRLICVGRDITERKQAEAALMEKTVYLDNILRSSTNMAIVATDLDLRIKYCNPLVDAFFGLHDLEVINRTVMEIHHAQKIASPRLRQAIEIVKREGEYKYKLELQTPTGTRYLAARVTGIWDKSQQLIGFVLMVQDITEHKQMEAKLQAYTHHLEQLVAAKIQELEQERTKSIQAGKLIALGEMATGVAHELNQPLTSMLFEADYLKLLARRAQTSEQPLDGDELSQIGEDLAQDITRCRRIIDHLRAFGRVSEGELYPVNLNQPIQDSFILIGERLKQHGILVKLELAPNLPLIWADPHKLEQVFLNLFSNAEYALDEKTRTVGDGYQKRLMVSTYREAERVVALVEDNGCGIPPTNQEHIFEPFFTTKPVGHGTGLGLSISYGIVTEFDGEILFESSENQGATFTLRFPIPTENQL